MKRQAFAIACYFFFASIGSAQSLADLARKEKERREEIKRARESLKQEKSARGESGVPGENVRRPFFARSSSGQASARGAAPRLSKSSTGPAPGTLRSSTERSQPCAEDAGIDSPCRQLAADPNGVLLKVPTGGLNKGSVSGPTASPAASRPAVARPRPTPATAGSGMRYSY